VGDMFHSHHNNEIHVFDIWRAQYEKLKIILVKGNHDILSKRRYQEMNIEVEEMLNIGSFLFSHEPVSEKKHYCFSGHIHPGIALYGQAKQSLKFPCFYFTPTTCILPAFGRFTGLAIVNPREEDKVYAIVKDKIVLL
jgi:DNA ligase-associated metallophosphoesterase